MRIELYFTPHQVDELSLLEKTVVVVDVLRASTTIATALRNGAREVIPVTTVESAIKISGNLFGDAILLGGERNGRMIEGFHLGNSPLEYNEEKVRGKAIIFSSTNGSHALVKSRYAREVVVSGFVNISATKEFLAELQRDFVIVCAGKNGMFCIEDAVCAGMLIQKLWDDKALDTDLSDAAVAARALYKSLGRNIVKTINTSEHGRYLEGIGFGADLPVCAGVDSIAVLPKLVGGVIRLKPDLDKGEMAQLSVSHS